MFAFAPGFLGIDSGLESSLDQAHGGGVAVTAVGGEEGDDPVGFTLDFSFKVLLVQLPQGDDGPTGVLNEGCVHGEGRVSGWRDAAGADRTDVKTRAASNAPRKRNGNGASQVHYPQDFLGRRRDGWFGQPMLWPKWECHQLS